MNGLLEAEVNKLRGRLPTAEDVERLLRLAGKTKGKPAAGCSRIAKRAHDTATARFLNALIQEPRVKLSATIVTAADKAYFTALQCLIVSLRLSHTCRIRVVDVGLTERQRKWCRTQGAEIVSHGKLLVPKTRFFWQSWNKPAFIAAINSPAIWLDADCIVTGSLSAMDDLLRDRPVMFTDTAAPHFNGWYEGTTSTANEPALYEDYPVARRFGRGDCPNAGVAGFDPTRQRDKKILESWQWMIRQAMKDKRLPPPLIANHPHCHGRIRWHDQGALQWALEKLNECDLVLADQRFNDPISAVGPMSLDGLTTKIHGLRQTRVVHFPSGSKPYHTFAKRFEPDTRGYPANRTDLRLFVLCHERRRFRAARGPCLKPIWLPDIDADNDLAESRVFTTNLLGMCDAEYIGLCTGRWNEKYAERCRPLADLHRLPMRPNVVWAACPAESWWLDYSEQAHPGMKQVIERVAVKMNAVGALRNRSLWSNNFIAHHGTVKELQEFVWRGMGIVRAEFGRAKYGMKGADVSRYGSYLAERLSMLYFAMRGDMEIRQIPL